MEQSDKILENALANGGEWERGAQRVPHGAERRGKSLAKSTEAARHLAGSDLFGTTLVKAADPITFTWLFYKVRSN